MTYEDRKPSCRTHLDKILLATQVRWSLAPGTPTTLLQYTHMELFRVQIKIKQLYIVLFCYFEYSLRWQESV